ncbi:MAG: M12 family metallopeptidase [Solitalea-like symbiont of Tyrophagus putrescentiae]
MQQINLKLLVTSIILIFIVSSCKRDVPLDATKYSNTTQNESSAYSLAINKTNGEVQLFKDFDTDHNYVSLGNDIILPKSQIETIKKYQSHKEIDWDDLHNIIEKHKNNKFVIKKNATKVISYGEPVCIWEGASTWACNDVFIQISNKFSVKRIKEIFAAIYMWMEASRDHINWYITLEGIAPFMDGTTRIQPSQTLFKECVSTLGELAANRGVAYISEQCSISDIAHNIGHILGFVNEEQRPRRDLSLILKQSALDLIEKEFGPTYKSFIKASLDTVLVQSDDIAFDHESIMINSSYSNNPVIDDYLRIYKEPLYTNASNEPIEKVSNLSFIDSIKVRRVYPMLHDEQTRGICDCKL